jgi:hypothetical protein
MVVLKIVRFYLVAIVHILIQLTNMTKNLRQLELKRKEYINIRWKSSSNVYICIVDVDDNYLLNIMRSVSKSLVVANHFPQVEEFQEYEGVTYSDWQKILLNEYLYREALVEQRYNQFVDRQMYEQSARDEEYYECIAEIYKL